MKPGEKIMFGLTIALTLAAIVEVGMRYSGGQQPAAPRDYAEWTPQAVQGYELYKRKGCNSCHRVMRVGEIGVAPVLDGEGTRRGREWLTAYFHRPAEVVAGSAHDGHLGPDFRALNDDEQRLLVEFMTSLRSNPGSSNYPLPPSVVNAGR